MLHRTPASLQTRCAATAAAAALGCWLVLSGGLVSAQVAADNDRDVVDVRLRIAWGGGEPRQWSGEMTVDGGELSDLQLLGREADTPGSIVNEQGEVRIYQPRPRRLDGFDVSASLPNDGALRLELSSSDDASPRVFLVRLQDILREPQRLELDTRDNTVLVHRAANDVLRIETDRESLLFRPGEQFSFVVHPTLLPPGVDQNCKLRVELRDARGIAIFTNQHNLAADPEAPLPVNLNLPLTDGSYTLGLSIERPPTKNYRLPFLAEDTQVLSRRTVELAVVGATPAPLAAVDQWPVRLDLDPTSPTWSSRLPQWVWLRRRPNIPRGPVGSRPPSFIMLESIKYVDLQPTTSSGGGDWQGYPLPTTEVGRPHVVEIDVPTGTSQQLVARVFEPNAQGALTPVGRGCVFYRDRVSRDDRSTIETVRYMFWPSTASATLVLQAAGNQPARYRGIRLRSAASVAGTGVTQRQPRARTHVAMIDNPWWASDLLDGGMQTPRGYADFYRACTRLADWMQLAGFDAAVLPIMHRGSSLAECGDYQSTPLLSRECIDSGMNDIPPCDVLELALAIFTSRGLALSPLVEFNGTDPQLEAALRRGDATVELIDARGIPWTRAFPTSRMPRRYDVAHPVVQTSQRDIAKRLVDSYSSSPAFLGLSVGLNGDSSIVPAGPYWDWGLHAEVIERLAATAELGADTLEQLRADPKRVLGDDRLRSQWQNWRRGQLAQHLATLKDIVERHPDHELWVLDHRSLDDVEFAPRLRPSVGTNVVSLAGWRSEHGIPSTPNGDFAVQRATVADDLVRKPLDYLAPTMTDVAASIADRNRKRVLQVSDAILVPAPSNIDGLRFADAAPRSVPRVAVPELQQRLMTHAMVAWDATRIVRCSPAAATDLPPDKLPAGGALRLPIGRSGETSQQPVWVRSFDDDDRSVVAAINTSAWPIDATVTLDVPHATTSRDLLDPASPAADYSRGRHIWQLRLPPYSVAALEFGAAGTVADGLRVTTPTALRDELADRVNALESRNLTGVDDFRPVGNLGMETEGDNQLPAGWTIATSEDGSAARDVELAYDGEASLKLDSTGGRSSVASEFFDNPGTGQLAVTAYLAIGKISDDASIVLAIENESGTYRRHTMLAATMLREHAKHRQWNGYTLGLEDIPHHTDQRLRVRIEAHGAATVHVDAVELHKLVFPLQRFEESKQQLVALASMVQLARKRLDEGQYTSCEAVLDSYWARFVERHLPEVQPAPQITSEPPAQSTESSDDSNPRLGNRLRDYWPGIFR